MSAQQTHDNSHDQSFMNVFMVVIGILVGITVALIVLARYMAGNEQGQWVLQEPAYAAAVDARIKPAGMVAVPGTEPANEEPVAEVAAAAGPPAAKLTGEQVYNAACFACHGAGIGGAPKFGDGGAWGPRIAQGKSTLHKHALEGFTGKAGFMPPKGGRVDLSDQEIIDAVDFMAGKSG